MRLSKLFFLVTLLTFLATFSLPTFASENIVMENVLKLDFVLHDFMQDDDGFFWIATNNGLFRYDGNQTKYFGKSNNTIQSNIVSSLQEDSQGRIWIATARGGLTVYDKDKNSFKTFRHSDNDPTSISSDNLMPILVDEKDNVWIGTESSAVSRYDHISGKFSNYSINWETRQLVQEGPYKETFISDIIQDVDGFIWVAVFRKGVIRINPDTMAFDHYSHQKNSKDNIGGDVIFSLLADDDGLIWFGGDESSGLSQFNPETGIYTHYKHNPDDPNTISGGNIREIYRHGNNIWVGHFFGGISIIDLETQKIKQIKKGDIKNSNLRSNDISKILQDKSGIFWIACLSGEVEKFNPSTININKFENDPNLPNSLSSNVVMVIYGDKKNNVWIGTGNEGLNKYNPNTNTFSHFKNEGKSSSGLPSSIVTNIFEDSLDQFWVATSNVSNAVLCLFDYEHNQCTKIYQHNPEDSNSPAKSQRVRAIIEDINNPGVLWIGYEGNLFDRFDTRTKTFTHYSINDPILKRGNPNIWDIVQDSTGKLWISTESNGLFTYNPDQKKFEYFHHSSDNDKSINSNQLGNLLIDKKNQLWVSTNDGFAKYVSQTNKFNRYNLKNSLYNDNTVLGFVEDNSGNLWLPSNGGLAKFDPETEAFTIFTKKDGLTSNAFFYKAFGRSSDGELWFGSLGGANSFFPKQITPNSHLPNIVLTSIKSGIADLTTTRAIEKTNEINLSWRNNFFEFEYAGLEYSQPHLNQYKYKLEGIDKDWVEAGNKRYGRYSGLAGGIYELKIIGSNNEGLWNEKGLTIKVSVENPFWKTRTFYSLIIGVVLIICLVIFFSENGKGFSFRVKLG